MKAFKKYIQSVKPSVTLALSAQVKELQSQGKDIINLTAGEPDFPTPRYIKDEAVQAIESNFTRYTPAIGMTELREAIASKINTLYQSRYTKDNVAVSNGGKHSISNIVYAIVNPDEEVIIPKPYWLSYPAIVQLVGGKPVFMETTPENNYKITAEDLRKTITDKTQMLFLNSPSNPSGSVYTREELKEIVAVIRETGIWLVADEIYDRLIYDGASFASLSQFSEIYDQLILINGASKNYSMTGWRIGFAIAPENLIKAVSTLQSHFTSNPCSISQKAALAAFSGEDNDLEKMVSAFAIRRNIGYNGLLSIPDVKCTKPAGSFYLFPDVSAYYSYANDVNDSPSLCSYLLQKYQVSTVPGKAFGCDNNIRISFATSESNLEEGVRRIALGLQDLKNNA